MKYLTSIAACGFLFLAACASAPRLTDSWRDPSVQDFQAKKTLVVAMSTEVSFRRVTEDEVVRQLAPGTGLASYGMLSAEDLADRKKAAELARAQGCDSALVVTVLEVDELRQQVPSATPTYVSFTGENMGWAYFWPTYDQGYSYMEKTYRVETNLFSLADDKLVWSGVVQVRDPGSVRELATQNSSAVLPELRRQKLLR